MSAALPIQKHQVGRTFTVALAVLGIGALVQFSAIGWLFLTRYRSNLYTEPAVGTSTPAASVSAVREFSDPFGDSTANSAVSAPAATPPPKPGPVPVLEHPATVSGPTDRLAELIE